MSTEHNLAKRKKLNEDERLSFEAFVVGKGGVDTSHASIVEFIKLRKEAFIKAWGEKSRYNTNTPIAQDNWPRTVFILAKNANGDVVGGTRMLVKQAKDANELPIAMRHPDKRTRSASHITVDAKKCPGDVVFIEPSIFVSVNFTGKGLSKPIMANMFEYLERNFNKHVVLVEAVPLSAHITRKAFEAKKTNQTAEIGSITSAYTGTRLAVLATTNLDKASLDLEGIVKIPGMAARFYK